MTKVRIGVIGCASIARRSVLPAIKALPDLFELIAVSSRNRQKADSFAKEFNCNSIEGYEELLRQDVDAVYIPLPTGLHNEWVNKALLAGKHVYAEKSIAFTYPDAQQMVKNARENNLALMEGLMFQFHVQHDLVKKILRDGTIGEIRGFRSSFGFPPLENGNFRYDHKIGGGVVFDAACYPVKAVSFILDSEFEVIASSLYFDSSVGTCTYGSAFLKGENGQSAHVAFGFDNFYQCDYEIWGTRGKVTATRAFTPRKDFSPEITLETERGKETILADKCDHFIGAVKEFHELCVSSRKREKHYQDILIQSKALTKILEMSKPVHG